jgi:translation initiation factor 3 subunit E
MRTKESSKLPHPAGDLESHHNANMADNTPTTASSLLNGAQALAAKTPEEVAREHDLLPRLITHLDRHLIFPLLQFVGDQEDEQSAENTAAKYELLKKTNMTDYVASLYCEIEGVGEPPKEFAAKRQEVLDRLELFGQESEKITDLLGREDVVTSLRSDKVANLEFLKKEHDVSLNV